MRLPVSTSVVKTLPLVSTAILWTQWNIPACRPFSEHLDAGVHPVAHIHQAVLIALGVDADAAFVARPLIARAGTAPGLHHIAVGIEPDHRRRGDAAGTSAVQCSLAGSWKSP